MTVGLTLETRASLRKDGRCTDCGRFMSPDALHFHSPRPTRKRIKVIRMMDDDGFVVSGTDDADEAREAARAKYRKDLEEDGWDGEDLAECLANVDRLKPRVGYYRWNPCHESSCYDGGGHSGHLGYQDGPGRGTFRGVYLR